MKRNVSQSGTINLLSFFMEKRAFEQTGLVPRSIIRTFDRFRRQLLKGAETSVIQEFRVSRYQVLVSVKCLVSLLIIPLVVNFLAKTFFLMPLTEYLWNTQQNEIFLNLYQENRAFSELHDFEEKLFFESLIETQSVPTLTLTPSEINNYTKTLLESSKTLYNGKNNEIIDVITKDTKKLSETSLHLFQRCQRGVENNLQRNLVLQPAPFLTPVFPSCHGTEDMGAGDGTHPQAHNQYILHFPRKCQKRCWQIKDVKGAEMSGEKSQKTKLPFNDLAPCADTLHCKRKFASSFLNITYDKSLICQGLPLGAVRKDQQERCWQITSYIPEKADKKVNFVIPWSKQKQTELTPSKNKLKHFKFEDKILHTSSFLETNKQQNRISKSVGDSKQIVFDGVKVNEEQGMSTFYLENSLPQKFQQKTIELAIYYNQQSIEAITNLFGDFITFITISFLFIWMEPQIIILKSFLTESLYSLSDTTKSFLLILLTDLLVGFHSPRGWEIFIELILRHFGLPENQDFIFLFVATFPVLLDTVFKYWIFRYLNQISPSTVATYHSMIE